MDIVRLQALIFALSCILQILQLFMVHKYTIIIYVILWYVFIVILMYFSEWWCCVIFCSISCLLHIWATLIFRSITVQYFVWCFYAVCIALLSCPVVMLVVCILLKTRSSWLTLLLFVKKLHGISQYHSCKMVTSGIPLSYREDY